MPSQHEATDDVHFQEEQVDVGPPPDGGRDAYLVVASSTLLLFSVFGFMNANGNLQAYWLSHQLSQYSKGTVAWQGSIQTFAEFTLAMVTGRYFDLHGARALTTGGTILCTVAVIGMAFSYSYYQLFLSNVLYGLAASAVFAPANAVVSQWFLKYRSTAVAIVVGGAGIGGVIFPIMLERLFSTIGYRNTMLTIAGFNFAMMLPSVFFMKARLPPRKPPPLSHMKHPWREARYCFLVAGSMFYIMNILSPFVHAIPYARANGLPDHITDYAIAIAGSGSVVGRLSMGVLADRVGVWRVFGSVGFVSSVCMFALWTPSGVGTAGTIIGLLWYGAASGAFFSLIGPAVASISPLEEVGFRVGLLITCMAIPSLVGPVISGELITAANDKWTYAGIFIGLTTLIAGVLTTAPIVYRKVRQWQGKQQTTEEEMDCHGLAAAPAIAAPVTMTDATEKDPGECVIGAMSIQQSPTIRARKVASEPDDDQI